jgi:predicted CoA-substrate-specific enzyme activase
MIYYMCKYTPLELLAGFGQPCRRLEPWGDSCEKAESLGHANICGYGKGLLEAALAPEVEELVLVNCCDVMRRIYDIVKRQKKFRFLHLMDLPHKAGKAEEGLLKKELERLAEHCRRSGMGAFETEKAWAELKHAEENGAESRSRPHISLRGAHGGAWLKEMADTILPLPLTDDTCSGNRRLQWEGEKPETEEEFLDGYSRALLSMYPCMRMRDVSERKREDEKARGILYHTMKFCDYYSFEYADGKAGNGLPLLKLETDGTRQSEGQLETRLEAFRESLFPGKIREAAEEQKHSAGSGEYAAGIDSGSASTDVVILGPGRELAAWAVVPTGAGAAVGAEKALKEALGKAGLKEQDLKKIVSTGYGRETVGRGDDAVTEITCHARGAFYLNPAVRTVIDIGGQDSKVIRIDDTGAVVSFAMNDKCAAGTGRFLEMMARTMEMSMEEMAETGEKWKKDVTISSMCTVFAESEVVSLIARNTEPADIIHGLNEAVAAKTASLVRRAGGGEACMMTGGVARNRGIVQALEKKLGTPVYVSEYSQICGALGAALIAMDEINKKKEEKKKYA